MGLCASNAPARRVIVVIVIIALARPGVVPMQLLRATAEVLHEHPRRAVKSPLPKVTRHFRDLIDTSVPSLPKLFGLLSGLQLAFRVAELILGLAQRVQHEGLDLIPAACGLILLDLRQRVRAQPLVHSLGPRCRVEVPLELLQASVELLFVGGRGGRFLDW